MTFKRITIDPAQTGGVPCIRGMRIPAATVVGMVADGMDGFEILQALPDLEEEDVAEALRSAVDEARRDDRVLISADFGTILAQTAAAEPSLVVFRRTTGRRAAQQAALLRAQPRRCSRAWSSTSWPAWSTSTRPTRRRLPSSPPAPPTRESTASAGPEDPYVGGLRP